MGSGIGWSEILVILLVALIVLGPKKLPDVAKSLGRSVRELRNAFYGLEQELRDDGDRKESVAARPVTGTDSQTAPKADSPAKEPGDAAAGPSEPTDNSTKDA